MRAALLAAALALLAAGEAAAKAGRDAPGIVVRYPSGDAPDPATLQLVMGNPAVSTIVFEKGTQLFSSTLFVFQRNDLTLCGATGDPRDVVIESSARVAIQVEQARGTVLRGLTVRTAAANGVGVLLNAVPSPTIESFADDTTIERCSFSAYIGVQASVRAKNLTVSRCTFAVGPFTPGSTDGGVGLLWEDGRGLHVTRSRFAPARAVSAIAGVFVRGAQTASSAGERARDVLLTRNQVEGDFAVAMDLADLEDAVVRGNRIRLPRALPASGRGRVGIVVRRAGATQVTENYEVARNQVRGAHYGIWFVAAGDGTCERNDLRGCGASAPDDPVVGFGDTGAAVRVNLLGGVCHTVFTRNDLRGLASPVAVPAIVLVPFGDACDEDANPGNRVDRGRALFGGQTP